MSMNNNPPHPGRIVRDECLEPLGLTVTEAARALGVTRQALNNLVNEKAGISPEMAVRLAKAFGSTAETWLRMQVLYDLAQVPQGSIRVKSYRKTRRIEYYALFEPAPEGGYVITFPDFGWGVSQGDTEEEAESMAAALLETLIQEHIRKGEPLPKPQIRRGKNYRVIHVALTAPERTPPQ